MDRKMRSIAGTKALDCGRVRVYEVAGPALKCARDAIARKHSFIVRYDLKGIDSVLSQGFAGNINGEVYSIKFDSYWCERDADADDKCLRIEKCTQPVRIFENTTRKGGVFDVSCVPPKDSSHR
jgi:hypothetical protein